MIAAGLYSAAFETWAPVTSRVIWLMVLAGFLLIFGHVCIFLAYRFAAPRTIAPFYYCFTVWAVISGVLVFGEIPDVISLIGMGLIVASGLGIVVIDGRRRAKCRVMSAGRLRSRRRPAFSTRSDQGRRNGRRRRFRHRASA